MEMSQDAWCCFRGNVLQHSQGIFFSLVFFPPLFSLHSFLFLPHTSSALTPHILVGSFAVPHFTEMTHLDLVGLKQECSTLRAFGNRSTAVLKRTLSVLCSTVSIHSYLVISQLFSLLGLSLPHIRHSSSVRLFLQ